MTGNAKRWKNIAADLQAQWKPPSVRKGRMARAKRRARLEAEAETAETNASETQKPGKPSGTHGKPHGAPVTRS